MPSEKSREGVFPPEKFSIDETLKDISLSQTMLFEVEASKVDRRVPEEVVTRSERMEKCWETKAATSPY
jgi:hypothetical protein